MAVPEIGTRLHWSARKRAMEINWQHPLSRGLIFCSLANVDLVSGVVASGLSTGINPNSPIKYGKALRTVDFNTPPTWPYQLIKGKLGGAQLSMFAYMQQGTGTTGICFGALNLAAAASGEFCLKTRSNTVGFQCENQQGSAGTMSASEFCSVGVIVYATSNLDLFKNGNRLGNINFVAYPGTISGLATNLGGPQTVDGTGQGAMSIGMIWNRALTISDMSELHANAYQVIRAP